MQNTIIENSIGYGILSFQGNIKAQNSLVHSCGAQALAILQGGRYEFDNCDFIIYAPPRLSHINEPTVAVLNYFDISSEQRIAGDLYARFRNCVIYGSLEEELFCRKEDAVAYDVSFEHCFIQHKNPLPEFVQQKQQYFRTTKQPAVCRCIETKFPTYCRVYLN